MIERHILGAGAYWKSYDFGPPGDASKNLNDCPLGPKTLSPPALMTCGPNKGFQQDGGEIIWNLPNGLQGYMLVNGLGNRLNEGPTNIVFDSSSAAQSFAGASPGTVVNGISCMACHTEGVRVAKDRILSRVLGPLSQFSADVKAATTNLYAKQDELDAVFADDRLTFLAALGKTGADSSSAESIIGLIRRFEKTVDLKAAAAELGLKAEELAGKRSSLPQDLQIAMVDVFEGGVMVRAQFAALFPKLAAALASQQQLNPTPQPNSSPQPTVIPLPLARAAAVFFRMAPAGMSLRIKLSKDAASFVLATVVRIPAVTISSEQISMRVRARLLLRGEPPFRSELITMVPTIVIGLPAFAHA